MFADEDWDEDPYEKLEAENQRLKDELAKYQPVKIDPEDESTWPPTSYRCLLLEKSIWILPDHDDFNDSYVPDIEHVKIAVNDMGVTHWMDVPPAPEET